MLCSVLYRIFIQERQSGISKYLRGQVPPSISFEKLHHLFFIMRIFILLHLHYKAMFKMRSIAITKYLSYDRPIVQLH